MNNDGDSCNELIDFFIKDVRNNRSSIKSTINSSEENNVNTFLNVSDNIDNNNDSKQSLNDVLNTKLEYHNIVNGFDSPNNFRISTQITDEIEMNNSLYKACLNTDQNDQATSLYDSIGYSNRMIDTVLNTLSNHKFEFADSLIYNNFNKSHLKSELTSENSDDHNVTANTLLVRTTSSIQNEIVQIAEKLGITYSNKYNITHPNQTLHELSSCHTNSDSNSCNLARMNKLISTLKGLHLSMDAENIENINLANPSTEQPTNNQTINHSINDFIELQNNCVQLKNGNTTRYEVSGQPVIEEVNDATENVTRFCSFFESSKSILNQQKAKNTKTFLILLESSNKDGNDEESELEEDSLLNENILGTIIDTQRHKKQLIEHYKDDVSFNEPMLYNQPHNPVLLSDNKKQLKSRYNLLHEKSQKRWYRYKSYVWFIKLYKFLQRSVMPRCFLDFCLQVGIGNREVQKCLTAIDQQSPRKIDFLSTSIVNEEEVKQRLIDNGITLNEQKKKYALNEFISHKNQFIHSSFLKWQTIPLLNFFTYIISSKHVKSILIYCCNSEIKYEYLVMHLFREGLLLTKYYHNKKLSFPYFQDASDLIYFGTASYHDFKVAPKSDYNAKHKKWAFFKKNKDIIVESEIAFTLTIDALAYVSPNQLELSFVPVSTEDCTYLLYYFKQCQFTNKFLRDWQELTNESSIVFNATYAYFKSLKVLRLNFKDFLRYLVTAKRFKVKRLIFDTVDFSRQNLTAKEASKILKIIAKLNIIANVLNLSVNNIDLTVIFKLLNNVNVRKINLDHNLLEDQSTAGSNFAKVLLEPIKFNFISLSNTKLSSAFISSFKQNFKVDQALKVSHKKAILHIIISNNELSIDDVIELTDCFKTVNTVKLPFLIFVLPNRQLTKYSLEVITDDIKPLLAETMANSDVKNSVDLLLDARRKVRYMSSLSVYLEDCYFGELDFFNCLNTIKNRRLVSLCLWNCKGNFYFLNDAYNLKTDILSFVSSELFAKNEGEKTGFDVDNTNKNSQDSLVRFYSNFIKTLNTKTVEFVNINFELLSTEAFADLFCNIIHNTSIESVDFSFCGLTDNHLYEITQRLGQLFYFGMIRSTNTKGNKDLILENVERFKFRSNKELSFLHSCEDYGSKFIHIKSLFLCYNNFKSSKLMQSFFVIMSQISPSLQYFNICQLDPLNVKNPNKNINLIQSEPEANRRSISFNSLAKNILEQKAPVITIDALQKEMSQCINEIAEINKKIQYFYDNYYFYSQEQLIDDTMKTLQLNEEKISFCNCLQKAIPQLFVNKALKEPLKVILGFNNLAFDDYINLNKAGNMDELTVELINSISVSSCAKSYSVFKSSVANLFGTMISIINLFDYTIISPNVEEQELLHVTKNWDETFKLTMAQFCSLFLLTPLQQHFLAVSCLFDIRSFECMLICYCHINLREDLNIISNLLGKDMSSYDKHLESVFKGNFRDLSTLVIVNTALTDQDLINMGLLLSYIYITISYINLSVNYLTIESRQELEALKTIIFNTQCRIINLDSNHFGDNIHIASLIIECSHSCSCEVMSLRNNRLGAEFLCHLISLLDQSRSAKAKDRAKNINQSGSQSFNFDTQTSTINRDNSNLSLGYTLSLSKEKLVHSANNLASVSSISLSGYKLVYRLVIQNGILLIIVYLFYYVCQSKNYITYDKRVLSQLIISSLICKLVIMIGALTLRYLFNMGFLHLKRINALYLSSLFNCVKHVFTNYDDQSLFTVLMNIGSILKLDKGIVRPVLLLENDDKDCLRLVNTAFHLSSRSDSSKMGFKHSRASRTTLLTLNKSYSEVKNNDCSNFSLLELFNSRSKKLKIRYHKSSENTSNLKVIDLRNNCLPTDQLIQALKCLIKHIPSLTLIYIAQNSSARVADEYESADYNDKIIEQIQSSLTEEERKKVVFDDYPYYSCFYIPDYKEFKKEKTVDNDFNMYMNALKKQVKKFSSIFDLNVQNIITKPSN